MAFRKRAAGTVLAKAGLALLALGALLWWGRPVLTALLRDKPTSPPAALPPGFFKASDGQWATLSLVKVEVRRFLEQRETEGKIATDDDHATPVFSPFSGRVTKVMAHAGDIVRKGDALAMIDAAEYAQAESDLATAVGNLAAARISLDALVAAEQRQHALFDSQGAALKDWQQSQVDLANGRAVLATAEGSLAAVRNRLRILGLGDGDIAALERAPEKVKASSEVAIIAPIDGTVISRQINPGEWINSGANNGTPVYVIGDLKKIWLIANLRETDSALPHKGDAAEVRVLAYPDRIFKGSVSYVAAAIDPATRRLLVRADIDNPDGALKPEMFASFRLVSSDGAAVAPAVPESSVIYEGNKIRLWVAKPEDKTLAVREVTIGRIADGMVEIKSGVAEGETVVAKGALFIDRAAKAN